MQLICERKDAVRLQSNRVDMPDLQGRDLLTLLVKANMEKDVPNNQRLSDEEVLARKLYQPVCDGISSLMRIFTEIPT